MVLGKSTMARSITEPVEPDKLFLDIADYVFDYQVESAAALETVHLDLFDALPDDRWVAQQRF